MAELEKYLKIRDKRERMGKYLNDRFLGEMMMFGRPLSQNEWARMLSDRAGAEVSSVSLGAWMKGDRLPEGDNRRALVNALGLEVYEVLEEDYFEATDELAKEVQAEADSMTPDDLRAIREIIERSRQRRGFYGRNGVNPVTENGAA